MMSPPHTRTLSVRVVVGVSLLGLVFAPGTLLAQESSTKLAETSPAAVALEAVAPAADSPATRLSRQVEFFTDRAAFEALFPALTLEDFEDLDVLPDSLCTGAPVLDAMTNVPGCVGTGDIAAGIELRVDNVAANLPDWAALGAGFLGVSSRVVGPNDTIDGFIFDFPEGDVFAVGFDVSCVFAGVGGADVIVYAPSGEILGMNTVFCDPAVRFRGMVSQMPMDRIHVAVTGFASEMFDNILFGTQQADLVFDFGGPGTWVLYDNGPNAPLTDGAMTDPGIGAGDVRGFTDTRRPIAGAPIYAQLHASSPEEMTVADIDGNGRPDVILDFPGFGVWAWKNDTSYQQLHTLNVSQLATIRRDDAADDLIMEFPGSGLWMLQAGSTWVPVHTLSANAMVTGDLDDNGLDEVIIDFPGAGLWAWFKSTWVRIHPFNPTAYTTGNLDTEPSSNYEDDVILAFPGFGVWAWMNNAQWVQLHTLGATAMASGDLTGNGQDDMVFEFPGAGLWIRTSTGDWSQLHTAHPEDYLTADIDGSGRQDVVIDFGAPGVWAWVNNTSWIQLHAMSPEGMSEGNLNGR